MRMSKAKAFNVPALLQGVATHADAKWDAVCNSMRAKGYRAFLREGGTMKNRWGHEVPDKGGVCVFVQEKWQASFVASNSGSGFEWLAVRIGATLAISCYNHPTGDIEVMMGELDALVRSAWLGSWICAGDFNVTYESSLLEGFLAPLDAVKVS